MDKNLKKLSRVQLLQLMVQLSEDRDALVAENEELRKRAAEKPSAPASMKVGSIAEAALQANGYFESAQNAADEYLREIKRMRDQIATRAASAGVASGKTKARVNPETLPTPQVQPVQQAQKAPQEQLTTSDQQQVDKIKAEAVQEAKTMSDRILARANAEAKAIIDDAQSRADAIIAKANRTSHTIISQANRQAESVTNASQSKMVSQLAVQEEPESVAQQSSQQPVQEASEQAAQEAPQQIIATLEEAPQGTTAQTAESGISDQQQVSSRQAQPMTSPSTTAEIVTRARHVRSIDWERRP